jgi:hypothetical protein
LVTVWLDLRGPDHDDLAVLSEEFGLHPLAVEAALHYSQRPKFDRCRSDLFLTAYGARLDSATGWIKWSMASSRRSRAWMTPWRSWRPSCSTMLRGLQVQLRNSLVLLRRIVIPMSEVVGELMRHDLHVVGMT